MIIKQNLKTAGKILNKYYQVYCEKSKSDVQKEYKELLLQAAIIQYEICTIIKEINESPKNSFARKVSIKRYLHCVYEYYYTLRKDHIKRLCGLAEKRNLPEVAKNIKEIGRNWRNELKAIDGFKNIRDKSSGHYDPDITVQVGNLESIDENRHIDIIRNFLRYNLEILKMLQAIGKGHV